jgi:hydrogenase nickel incorporation protein HypA/HybF
MHELGIVMYFIDIVEKTAEENNAKEVVSVTLEIGEVSTIVPSYFRDCYKWAIKQTKYMQNCELNLVIIEAMSFCRDCRKTYSTTAYGKTCPYCQSKDTYLVTGNEVTVREVQIK